MSTKLEVGMVVDVNPAAFPAGEKRFETGRLHRIYKDGQVQVAGPVGNVAVKTDPKNVRPAETPEAREQRRTLEMCEVATSLALELKRWVENAKARMTEMHKIFRDLAQRSLDNFYTLGDELSWKMDDLFRAEAEVHTIIRYGFEKVIAEYADGKLNIEHLAEKLVECNTALSSDCLNCPAEHSSTSVMHNFKEEQTKAKMCRMASSNDALRTVRYAQAKMERLRTAW